MNELSSRNDFHISGGQRCSCLVSGFRRKKRPLPVCSAGQTMVVTADMILLDYDRFCGEYGRFVFYVDSDAINLCKKIPHLEVLFPSITSGIL